MLTIVSLIDYDYYLLLGCVVSSIVIFTSLAVFLVIESGK